MVRRLASQLRALGAELCFGVPGSGLTLEFAMEFAAHGGKFVSSGHEQTAVLMAAGAAQVSGKPAVSLSIKGPGILNSLPGLATCAYEGFPAIHLAEAYPENLQVKRRHKWLPHSRLPTLFPIGIYPSESVTAQSCWDDARGEYPGPVLIELVGGPGQEAPRRRIPEAASVSLGEDLFQRIARSQRPILLVGSLGLRAAWRDRLSSLRLPVFTTAAGKGCLDEMGAFAAGVFTGSGKPLSSERHILPEADLVVEVGIRAGELLCEKVDHPEIVSVETKDLSIGSLFPDDPAISDRLFLSAAQFDRMFDALSSVNWGRELLDDTRRQVFGKIDALGWGPAEAFAAAEEALKLETMHFLDTGAFTVVGEHCLRASVLQRVYGTPNSRSMGASLGLALGSAFSGARTLLWIGDGGIRAHLAELALAGGSQLPLLVVVMCDGYYGSIRSATKHNAPHLLKLTWPNLPSALGALGFEVIEAGNKEEIRQQIANWSAAPIPRVLLANFLPENYSAAADLLR